MIARSLLTGLVVMTVLHPGSNTPELLWNPFHSKPHAPKAAKPAKPPKRATGTDLIHTRVQFLLEGKVVTPAGTADAVLYDASEPGGSEAVSLISRSGDGVQQSKRVCGTIIQGYGDTVGPSGDVYFDYVDRGNYWIVVCKQLKFAGVAKPVWVSGAVPVDAAGFTTANLDAYEVPQTIEINLDPYVVELKAKPVGLSAMAAVEPGP